MEPKYKRVAPPRKAFFTWEITYKCNYNCTYCHAPKHSTAHVPSTVYPGLEKWMKIWGKMYDEYGECDIIVSGGEPFVYPDFMMLAENICKKHIIEFTTNLHFDVSNVVNRFSPGRARFGTSFHPEAVDLNTFLQKAVILDKSGFEIFVNIVPWPPFLHKLGEYKKAFESNGIKVVLQPFIGQYQGHHYPHGYSQEEKKMLGIFNEADNKEVVDFKTTQRSQKKGKLCRMGQNYAFIHPDGSADRCCKDKTVKLGNIIGGTFRLLDEPVPCMAEECNCWRCMLVGKENDWAGTWRGEKGNTMIQFAWDIHFSCNYRCPYCWFNGKWDDIKINNIYPGTGELISAWKKVYDMYGKVSVQIAGGEPLTYPGIVEFLAGLSTMHDVGITTNLSCEVDELVGIKNDISVGMSFHPEFTELDSFMYKAQKIKNRGFGSSVLYLAYPSQIEKIHYYKKLFEKEGFIFGVLTFWGRYKNAAYPEAYTNKEKDIINSALTVRGESKEKYQLAPQITKGRQCNAGHTYSLVHPNGNVYRCGGGNWKDQHQPFANLFKSDFALLKGPQPCESENCPCNEWSFLLVK